MAYIYKITNLINGHSYIGQTQRTIELRYRAHQVEASNDENSPLHIAMRKYGLDNFIVEQIEECPIDQLDEREIFWIEKYDTYKHGYNATLGGKAVRKYNYEQLAQYYLETKCITDVCRKFNCDHRTVQNACKAFNIEILSNGQVLKNKISKPVYMLDKETEEIITEFSSLTEAAKFASKGKSKDSSQIIKCCKGKAKTAFGYKWQYK